MCGCLQRSRQTEYLTKIREDLQQEANRVDDEIANHVDVIRCEVDAVKQDVIQTHKTEFAKNTEAIDRMEEALKQQLSQIDTFKMKVTQLQNMNDFVELIRAGRNIDVLDINRIPRPDIQTLVFIPGAVGDGELKGIFGNIKRACHYSNNDAVTITCDKGADEDDDNSTLSSDFVGSIEKGSYIKITPVISFKLFKPDGVDAMFCSSLGICWLKCRDDNSVKLSNTSGYIKQSINLGTKSKGFTVTSDNRILFCCTNQQCIKEMKLPNSDIIEKFSTRPLTPNRLCTGPSGDIYVTHSAMKTGFRIAWNKGDDDDSTGVLVQYDSRGQEKNRCKSDGHSRSIFVLPEEVCVNNRRFARDICPFKIER